MAAAWWSKTRARTLLTRPVQGILHRLGYELTRYPSLEYARRRVLLMASGGIDVVVDVGAKPGQYAHEIRTAGFAGRIVSFEPLSEAYSQLRARAASDPAWEVRRLALGDRDAAVEINVAGNSWSSSLLPMGAQHLRSAPESAYVGREPVAMARLDSVSTDVVSPSERAWLKLDVQGYEMHVLRGAGESIATISAVQAELSLVPLYDGDTPWQDIVRWLGERGFTLAGLAPGFADAETGRHLQFDGIFLPPDQATRARD